MKIVMLMPFVAWLMAPYLMIVTRPMDLGDRLRVMWSVYSTLPKALVVMAAALMAPFVVPIALLMTPKSADALPWWARPWDNDVSINGDRKEYWDPSYAGSTYYSPFGPRTYVSRLIWLVWRNRASWLAQYLGYTYGPGEYANEQTWGDPLVGRDHEGWQVNRRGSKWQLYLTKRFGRVCLRANLGHKLWSGTGDGRATAMVVWIPFTLVSWTGA